ncbi:hypothetical protein ACFE04_009502 [Oxalis oulophora]
MKTVEHTYARKSTGDLPELEFFKFLEEVCIEKEISSRISKHFMDDPQLGRVWDNPSSDTESETALPEPKNLKSRGNPKHKTMGLQNNFCPEDGNFTDRSSKRIVPATRQVKKVPMQTTVGRQEFRKTKVSLKQTSKSADWKDYVGFENMICSNQSAPCQHSPEKSNLSGPLNSLVPNSGSLPNSGNLSLRSNSSNASAQSFSFPILAPEVMESPVRMVPRRIKPSKKLGFRRKLISLCCKF